MKNDFYIVKKHYVTLCSLMDVIFFTSYIHFIYIHKLMHHPIIILHNYFIILTTQRNFINFIALTLCPLVRMILINIAFQPHSNRREYGRNLNMVKFLILHCYYIMSFGSYNINKYCISTLLKSMRVLEKFKYGKILNMSSRINKYCFSPFKSMKNVLYAYDDKRGDYKIFT